MRKLLAFYFFFSFVVTGNGQLFYFRHYGVENGLSNNSVINIAQDSLGFMWFGTSDGLNKFDGNSFSVYRNTGDAGSLGSNSIYSLLKDERGVVWVGTEKGLYHYNYESDSFSLLQIAPRGPVRSILPNGMEGIFFVIKNELFHYSTLTRILTKRSFSNVKELTTIYRQNKDPNLWLGTSDGRLLHCSRDSIVSYDLSLNHLNSIEVIAGGNDGHLLIGTSAKGLIKFNTGNASMYPVLNKQNTGEDIFVRGILQQSDSTWFISTERGLFLYNQHTNGFKRFQKDIANPYSLSDNALYGMYMDNEGGIWIGSYFGGIHYLSYNNNQFEKFFPTTDENSISGNAIREIVKDEDGYLWIGSEDGGLSRYDLRQQVFTRYYPDAANGLSSFNLHGLLPLGRELLIGTFEHGLEVLDTRTNKVTKKYVAGKNEGQLQSNFINKIYRTSKNKILVCTAEGVYYFDRAKGSFTPHHGLARNVFYSAIRESSNGYIWIGTHNNGLFYVDGENVQRYIPPGVNKDIFTSTRIVYLMEDTDRQIWVCTINGLYCINSRNGNYTLYNLASGFPADLVYSIVQDDDKDYWVATSQGLVKMNYQTKQLEIFTQNNGLLNNQFNYQSVYKDSNGDIYMGSIKGIIRFNPGRFSTNNFIPPVYFTSVQFPNTAIELKSDKEVNLSLLVSKSLTLSHRQSTFGIGFASLCYSAPANIRYEYRINNSSWNKTDNNRQLFFTGLNAGKYLLTVRSTDSRGVWMDNSRSILIEILPPFWKSVPAYILYGLLLAGSGIFAFYLYGKRQKQKHRYKMQLFSLRKEKELYESKMNFFTNVTHEIKTPLTLIKIPLEKISKMAAGVPGMEQYLQIMNNNTNRLLELTQQLLDFRQVESENYQLYVSDINLVELTEHIASGFSSICKEKNIQFGLRKPQHKVMVAADPEALTKIITNLIDNAVKYCERLIHLSFECGPKDKEVSLVIENDGDIVPAELRQKVFEPFFRHDHNGTKGSGLGLALAYSLAELNDAQLAYSVRNNLNVFSITFNRKRNQTLNRAENDHE